MNDVFSFHDIDDFTFSVEDEPFPVRRKFVIKTFHIPYEKGIMVQDDIEKVLDSIGMEELIDEIIRCLQLPREFMYGKEKAEMEDLDAFEKYFNRVFGI